MATILFLTTGLLAGYVISTFKRANDSNYITQKQARDLNCLFNHFWNGKKDDELFAWQRVKNHILNWKPYPTKAMIAYIETRISILDTNHIKSEIFVEANGKITGNPVDLYNSKLI